MSTTSPYQAIVVYGLRISLGGQQQFHHGSAGTKQLRPVSRGLYKVISLDLIDPRTCPRFVLPEIAALLVSVTPRSSHETWATDSGPMSRAAAQCNAGCIASKPNS